MIFWRSYFYVKLFLLIMTKANVYWNIISYIYYNTYKHI